MVAVELVADRASRAPFPASERRAALACQRMVERGVWIRPLGDSLIVNPPFSITDDEIAWLCEELALAVDAVCP